MKNISRFRDSKNCKQVQLEHMCTTSVAFKKNAETEVKMQHVNKNESLRPKTLFKHYVHTPGSHSLCSFFYSHVSKIATLI